jgi:hypothetical protein
LVLTCSQSIISILVRLLAIFLMLGSLHTFISMLLGPHGLVSVLPVGLQGLISVLNGLHGFTLKLI